MLIGIGGIRDVGLATQIVHDQPRRLGILVVRDGVPGVPRLPEGDQYPGGDPRTGRIARLAPPPAVVAPGSDERLDVGLQLECLRVGQALAFARCTATSATMRLATPDVGLPTVRRQEVPQLGVERADEGRLQRDLEGALPGDHVVGQVDGFDRGRVFDDASRRRRLRVTSQLHGEAQLDGVAAATGHGCAEADRRCALVDRAAGHPKTEVRPVRCGPIVRPSVERDSLGSDRDDDVQGRRRAVRHERAQRHLVSHPQEARQGRPYEQRLRDQQLASLPLRPASRP